MSEYDVPEMLSEAEFTQLFFDSVVEFQQLLDLHPESDLTEEMRRGIIEELDEKCPYAGETVFANGQGIVPSFDYDGEWNGDAITQTRTDAEIGIHVGVAIIPDPENTKRPLIVHQIMQQTEFLPRGLTCQTINKYFSYFDMNTSLTMLDEIESVLQCENGENPRANPAWEMELRRYTKDMYNLIRSTAFRRRNKRSQQAQIEMLTYEAEKQTALRDKQLSVAASYSYVSVRTVKEQTLIPLDISEWAIEGTCLGFVSLDVLTVRNRPIRSDKDRPDELAGLCLIVEPVLPIKQVLRLDNNAILYIPTGQDMECELVS